jgi:hypothetical protein
MSVGVEITCLEVPVCDKEAFLGAIAGVLQLHDLLRSSNDVERSAPDHISPPPPPPRQSGRFSIGNINVAGGDDLSSPDANGMHNATGNDTEEDEVNSVTGSE